MNRICFRTISLFLPFLAAVLVLTPAQVSAECSPTVTVTNSADSGAGSLREAIIEVCDLGTINFDGNYTIVLSSNQLNISKNLTIDGTGHNVKVSGNDAFRVFLISSDTTCYLNNLTLEHGSADNGGVIYNSGTLYVTDCTISGTATGSGGGIFNGGAATVTHCTISDSSAGMGGGISTASGTLSVSDSKITGNSAFDYGGGIRCSVGVAGSTVNVTNSSITYNTATFGGGIQSSGCQMTVTDSKISQNSPTNRGGGIHHDGGTMIVKNSTISDNSATSLGGGIFSDHDNMSVINSTISGNSAAVRGGGIYNSTYPLYVINSTISGNSATSVDGLGGGIYCPSATVSVTMKNSIVASSASGADCKGSITGVANLADDDSCGSSFINSPDIRLGPLGDYGGSTQTMPLLPGSSAIDQGDSATCEDPTTVNNLDQRGLPRPIRHCDIGAFEAQGYNLSIAGGDYQSAGINYSFALPLKVTVTETGGLGLPGAVITFTAPPSSASTNPAIFTATTGAGGIASATATANGVAGGPYVVAASTADGAFVNFFLTNLPLDSLRVRLLPGGNLFAAIHDAYNSATTSSITIQAQVYDFGEGVIFDNASLNVILSGGMDSGFNPTTGYSTIHYLTVAAGQAVVSNIVVR